MKTKSTTVEILSSLETRRTVSRLCIYNSRNSIKLGNEGHLLPASESTTVEILSSLETIIGGAVLFLSTTVEILSSLGTLRKKGKLYIYNSRNSIKLGNLPSRR